jgi:hypothetical protein
VAGLGEREAIPEGKSRVVDYIWRKNSIIFLFCCIVFWSYLYIGVLVNRAHVEVGLEVPCNSTLQIFWEKEGRGYIEDKMTDVFVHPGKTNYSFNLTDLSEVDKLRIDPIKHSGRVKLLYLNMYQHGFMPTELTGSSGLAGLQPYNQVDGLRLDSSGLEFISLGEDPGLELYPDLSPIDTAWWPKVAVLLFLIVTTWLIGVLCSTLLIHHRFVLLLLAGAWMLIWVMAVTTRQNCHPDEYVHLAAITWYHDTWMPPEIEDPAIRDTYSVYGYSRLNNGELYYPLAGKMHKLVSLAGMNGLQSLRFVNVALFGALLLAAIAVPCARLVAFPFLISPQIWYVFSYCNSDGFGLAVCFLVCCELVCKGSVFNRYLQSHSIPRLLFSAIYLGGVVGALLLLKHNYYAFAGFAVAFIFVKHVLPSDREARKPLLQRLAAVAAIGLMLFGARMWVDYHVNGFDRAEKIAAMHEATAHHLYSKNTPADKRIFSMSLKERGESLQAIIENHDWFEKSFRSGFGVYGYFSVKGSVTYYEIVRAVALALLLFMTLSLVVRGGTEERLLVMIMTLLSAALIFASLYHSWTVDLQPQGRYLMAIVPMLALLYANSHHLASRTIMAAGVIALFVLSTYSFIFYGLMQLPGVVS